MTSLPPFDLGMLLCQGKDWFDNFGGFNGRTVIGKPGPFQVIQDQGCSSPDAPVTPPRRRYECPNYETCLNLAAAFNWHSFTCRGCSGEIDERLHWRAHQIQKKDKLVNMICDLPALQMHQRDDFPDPPRKIAAKR